MQSNELTQSFGHDRIKEIATFYFGKEVKDIDYDSGFLRLKIFFKQKLGVGVKDYKHTPPQECSHVFDIRLVEDMLQAYSKHQKINITSFRYSGPLFGKILFAA